MLPKYIWCINELINSTVHLNQLKASCTCTPILTSFTPRSWTPALSPLSGALPNHLPLNSLLPWGLNAFHPVPLLIKSLLMIEMPHMTFNTIHILHLCLSWLYQFKLWIQWRWDIPPRFRECIKLDSHLSNGLAERTVFSDHLHFR